MKKRDKTYVLFGYRGAQDMDTTGFLEVGADGKYRVTAEMAEATRFKDPSVSAFFNGEDELNPWRFHPVAVVY